MNPGCDSLKKRRSAARLASLYADQASVSSEVFHFSILSINRVHEVSVHFLASVLDRNDPHYTMKNMAASSIFCRPMLHPADHLKIHIPAVFADNTDLPAVLASITDRSGNLLHQIEFLEFTCAFLPARLG